MSLPLPPDGPVDAADATMSHQPTGDDQPNTIDPHKARATETYAAEFRSVRLPTFWKNRPGLWFIHLESEFNAYRVRSDDARYNAIVRHLDEEVMIAVADILEAPPVTGKYDSLKKHLIKRFTDSQEKQLRTLLRGIELGDKKPSQLLREMKTLAGTEATEGLLRTLWLQRLPARIQQFLLIIEGTTISKLAECADKLWEHPTTQEIQAVTVPQASQEDLVSQLAKQVSELTLRIDEMSRNGSRNHRSRSRPRTRPGYRSRSRTPSNPSMCYYHRRFADKARKCTTPCSYRPTEESENKQDRRQ
ncbi:uncharacterized protein [Polyergus mexicanus]|uniref:uncharacterized protein n=1 Tax=Polyergus mexicanus TaxID=615972 RepID=UPI0038B59169